MAEHRREESVMCPEFFDTRERWMEEGMLINHESGVRPHISTERHICC